LLSKFLRGPTTRMEGKERCDSKGREKARKAHLVSSIETLDEHHVNIVTK